jgi:hypothetical protein
MSVVISIALLLAPSSTAAIDLEKYLFARRPARTCTRANGSVPWLSAKIVNIFGPLPLWQIAEMRRLFG